jgi:hypothetical protein
MIYSSNLDDESNLSENNNTSEKISTTNKIKTSTKRESSERNSKFSLDILGKKKLTRAEKRFNKYKKSIRKIKDIDIKINCIYLNDLTKFNNKKLKDDYYKEKAELDKKKFLNMIKFYKNNIY